jgi:hypothetical protein
MFAPKADRLRIHRRHLNLTSQTNAAAMHLSVRVQVSRRARQWRSRKAAADK